MIDSLEIDNYKCLDGVIFRAAKCTLLTGTNSVGKSSLIQSLLLSRLAALHAASADAVIPLNGPYGLSLGEFLDIIRHDVVSGTESEITFRYLIEGIQYSLSLRAEVETARYAAFEFTQKPPELFCKPGLGTFCYLSAEREGPRNSALIQSAPKDRMEIGSRGQYVADVLEICDRDAVLPVLEHPGAAGQRFSKQVEAWLATFVPNVEIRVEPARNVDVAALRFKRGGLSAEWERPSNTGFGVSYCLPIVVAGLVAKPGSLFLIDSPEAHLHPSAQSAMGSFLGRLAAAGVQLFVETHSDHVLNGIRLATVDDSHPLDRRDVVINHLRIEGGVVAKEEVSIDHRGNLSSRPREFFDQAEHDIGAIVRKRFS